MPMHLVVANRVISTGEFYDSLQDTKEDYPWERWEVWVDNGKLYAKVLAPSNYRKELRTAGLNQLYY